MGNCNCNPAVEICLCAELEGASRAVRKRFQNFKWGLSVKEQEQMKQGIEPKRLRRAKGWFNE